MRAADLTARVRRLQQLALGIAREIQLVEKSDIFLYRERRDYFDALRRIWVGLEDARVALVKARQRLAR
jgi:hypothetical protein